MDLLQAGDPEEALDKGNHPFADEGLPPGETNLPHTEGNKGPDKTLHLLETENVVMGDEGDPLIGHTVAATEITTVCHGQTQVGDLPTAGVF